MLRTHTNGELTKKSLDKKVTLCGWVHRRRDHGGLIFIDLRDRYGITQIKFDQKIDKKTWQEASRLRSEWVIQVEGKVVARSKETINKKMATGEIEIEAAKLKIFSEAKTLPFEITEEKGSEAGEDIRLKYRYLDLRRQKIQEILQKRDKMYILIRDYMHRQGFTEIQTPILANNSPEGAGSRCFVIPSRLYPGKFYILPQAPQQFKQLLMVGGLDRYFQIVPCFRDEDNRKDRHYGEFYQLDMEMSFVEQEDVFKVAEPLMKILTEKLSNKKMYKLKKDGRFMQLTWKEAMEKYGSDKPDMRFELPIKPISNLVKDCGFKVFNEALKNKGVVHALKIDGGAKFTRSQIDKLTEIAKSKDAKGLAYIVVEPASATSFAKATAVKKATASEGGFNLRSPITKFLGEVLAQKIVKEVDANVGDIIFFGADKWEIVCKALGAVRSECGAILNLKDKKKAAWLWIVDFPMYSYDPEEGKIDFEHNPFSMPQGGLKALKEKDPLDIFAYQYDLVLNGYEVCSGSVRNHEPETMYKAFEIAGYSREEVDKGFGHMIKAFQYGVPPHAGMAPGIDRILMTLLEVDSIRDVYAFPKDAKGKDLMLGVPSEVSEKQLKEVHIQVRK